MGIIIALLILFAVFVVLYIILLIALQFNNKSEGEEIKNILRTRKESKLLKLKDKEPLILKEKVDYKILRKVESDAKPVNNNVENKIFEIKKYDFETWKLHIIASLDKCYTVADLLILKSPSSIYYGDLLLTFEWRYKRLMILLRDSFICKDCGVQKLNNHIHHNYYIQDRFPWDVFDDGLVTLCKDCHESRHENKTIPVYICVDKLFTEVVSREDPRCTRCGGAGYIPQFWYYQDGVCFKCNGNVVSNGIFEKALNGIYKYLNNYDDACKLKRIKSNNYINSLSDSTLIIKLPNYKDFIINEKKSLVEDFYDVDEDLPF